jgi:hypothetical protein
VVVIERLGGSIVIENCLDVVLAAVSAAWTVKLNDPAAVGEPLRTPLEERLSPPGNDPEITDHVYGGVPALALKV